MLQLHLFRRENYTHMPMSDSRSVNIRRQYFSVTRVDHYNILLQAFDDSPSKVMWWGYDLDALK